MTKEEAVNEMMKESFLGYESPIQAILSDMRLEYEENMVRAVQNVGFYVNKEELIKALHYDRGQYEKGYADAKKAFDLPHGAWKIDIEYGYIFHCVCSKCDTDVMKYISGSENWWLNSVPNFCPNCGASMQANDRQVTGKLNSKIEKSNSEICPCIECCKIDNSEPCRKGCSEYQKWKEGDEK